MQHVGRVLSKGAGFFDMLVPGVAGAWFWSPTLFLLPIGRAKTTEWKLKLATALVDTPQALWPSRLIGLFHIFMLLWLHRVYGTLVGLSDESLFTVDICNEVHIDPYTATQLSAAMATASYALIVADLTREDKGLLNYIGLFGWSVLLTSSNHDHNGYIVRLPKQRTPPRTYTHTHITSQVYPTTLIHAIVFRSSRIVRSRTIVSRSATSAN